MTDDTTSRFAKMIASFLGNISMLVYFILFLPALIHIPLLGFLSFFSPNMSTAGALLCVIGATTVPLSMPVSIYFVCKYSSAGQMKKMLFFSCLPIFCSIFAILWIEFICFLHQMKNLAIK